mgnify:CR=1 FL=1
MNDLEQYAERARVAVAAIKQLPNLSQPDAAGHCPQCGGAAQDNTKRSGNRPLYKCLAGCGWIVWPRSKYASTGDKAEQRPGRPHGYK